jgi:hypothetical protein
MTRFAGITYVTAWVVGLVVAPAGPKTSAGAAEILGYYSANAGSVAVQSALVHGVAGLALAAVGVGLARAHADERVARGLRSAAIGAAAVSLVQFGLGQYAALHVAGSADSALAADVFHAVNLLDALKMILLSAMVASGAVLALRRRRLSRALGWTGVATIPFLLFGGLGFVIESDALFVLLAPALLGLLVWVGWATTVSGRAGTASSSRLPSAAAPGAGR